MEKKLNFEDILNRFKELAQAAEDAENALESGYPDDKSEAETIAAALGIGMLLLQPAIKSLINAEKRRQESKPTIEFNK